MWLPHHRRGLTETAAPVLLGVWKFHNTSNTSNNSAKPSSAEIKNWPKPTVYCVGYCHLCSADTVVRTLVCWLMITQQCLMKTWCIFSRISWWKNFENRSAFAKVIIKHQVASFFWGTASHFTFWISFCRVESLSIQASRSKLSWLFTCPQILFVTDIRMLNFLYCILIGIFHWENVLNFHGCKNGGHFERRAAIGQRNNHITTTLLFTRGS